MISYDRATTSYERAMTIDEISDERAMTSYEISYKSAMRELRLAL